MLVGGVKHSAHFVNSCVGEVFIYVANCTEGMIGVTLHSFLEVIYQNVIKLLVESAELSELANEVGLMNRMVHFVRVVRKAFAPDEIYDVHLFHDSTLSQVSLLFLFLAVSCTSPSVGAGGAAEPSGKRHEVAILVTLPLFQLLGNFPLHFCAQIGLVSIIMLGHVDFIGKDVVSFEFGKPANEQIEESEEEGRDTTDSSEHLQ